MSIVTSQSPRQHLRSADEDGQGTVEYVGLAMAIGVLLLAVTSYLGGTGSRRRLDHHRRDQVGALQQASGGAK